MIFLPHYYVGAQLYWANVSPKKKKKTLLGKSATSFTLQAKTDKSWAKFLQSPKRAKFYTII